MLENLLKYKNKEILRLEYLNKHLIMTLKKRDEMLSHTIEENRKFKELNILYERMMDGSLHPRKRNTNGFPTSRQSIIKQVSPLIYKEKFLTTTDSPFKKIPSFPLIKG